MQRALQGNRWARIYVEYGDPNASQAALDAETEEHLGTDAIANADLVRVCATSPARPRHRADRNLQRARESLVLFRDLRGPTQLYDRIASGL